MLASRRFIQGALLSSIAIFCSFVTLYAFRSSLGLEEHWTRVKPHFDKLNPWSFAAGKEAAQYTPYTPVDESLPVPDKVVVVPKLHSENTEWVDNELPGWTPAIYTVDDPSAPLHTSENKGREALVYLRYIVDHYERLPQTMAFVHSHKDGYPQAWHNDNPDYSNVVTLMRLQTDAVQRKGFVNLRCNGDPGCPAEVQLNRIPVDETRTIEVHMPAAWGHFFPNTTLPDTIATPCCAQIAVSADQIRKRSLEDYKKYRQWLLDTRLDDDTSGRVMEYLWHIIFGQEPVFCPDIQQCYCDLYGWCNA